LRFGQVVQLEFPCDAIYVSLARQAVVDVARCLRFKASDLEDMTMAIGEACSNAVRYSHGSKNVRIRCEVLRDGMTVEIGNAVAECDFPKVLTEPDLEREGGRGLFIMSALMDEVDLLKSHGYATVRMTKRIKPSRRSGSKHLAA
jgi:serine/threonine-protein kinase RsbW